MVRELEPGDQGGSCYVAQGRPSALSGPPFHHQPHVQAESEALQASCSLSLGGLQFGQQRWKAGLSGPGWAVFHVSGEARSMKSGKVAPEEDVDGQQEDSIDVADASPERLLLNAGQLQL